MLKHWTSQTVVSFCCQHDGCYEKVECVIESNNIRKIVKCPECGKEYEVFGGYEVIDDAKKKQQKSIFAPSD